MWLGLGAREGQGRQWGPRCSVWWTLFQGFLLSLQTVHLGMQVLMLNCGVQQILAGDLTQGGLLSFLLYEEDMGHYVQVSQEPGHTLTNPHPLPQFSLWPLGLGLCLSSLKIQTKPTPSSLYYGELQIYAPQKGMNYNEPACTHHLL